ncbi:hypothetical protein I316_05179 [Kwoniella heveanensis BCC8398]|uniref:RRM domain-containing protein n=1 Tax=Kwoniella heveanensis BCC8398 TaxID=1296120 RepID=A0A1B9GPW1_9TREE|nr:hypothetical protein I316_05179 [Kwoniella heveanensis BCC8398]
MSKPVKLTTTLGQMHAIHPVRSHSSHSHSPSRTPTSAEIDAVIAQAIANAPPPPPPPQQEVFETDLSVDVTRSVTPLMTNLLPSAVGADGRVNLFVGNLPYRVRWQDLKDLFRKAGTVLRADVSLGPDNRSRGYGTVLMGSREDAARAIDRYNGYTWQTRTLEVRPDRLPPEYEPQQTHMPHPIQHHNQHQHGHQNQHPQHHHNSRPGMFGFHSLPTGGHPYPLHGYLAPQGGGWEGGHGGRPPFPPSQGSGSGSHGLLMPGLGHSPAAPPMGLSGSSPVLSSQSPAAMFGSVSLPLSVQNTGPQPYPQLAASPLAGSLSAGTGPSSSINLAGGSESLTPFSHGSSPDPVVSHLRSTSPAPAMARTGSRPVSTNGQPLPGSSPATDVTNRAPAPGALGTLPQPPFAQPKAVVPPTGSTNEAGPRADTTGISPSISNRIPPVAAIPQLEGLAHQGMGLGPPETLHDRVIFVSNLPLSMQWQDLKDLLRPAGHIIRADVATDTDGRPRGFGTALFAAEADAARAVTMFDEREVGGNRIKAHLERQSRHDGTPSVHNGIGDNLTHADGQITPPHPLSIDAAPSASEGVQRNGIPPPIDTKPPTESTSRRPSATATAENSPAAKLPWSLNTSLQQQTPGRPANNGGHGLNHMTPGPHQHTPNFRQLHHPGPISMPSFPAIDHNNPLSPIGARGLPPMTPSMPGFVFNAYPETPPLHPHFMSPGLGPFSPGIPVSSPNAFGYNPFLNAAPGAPVNRYPAPPNQQGGSAALGTPTTQAFPNGPTPGTIHQYAGPPGQPLNISQTLSSGQGYFPPISTTAPDTPTPKLGPKSIPGVSPLNAQERLASNTDTELASKANRLRLDGHDGEDGQDKSLRPASTSDVRSKGRSNDNGTPESPVRRSASEVRGLGFAAGSGLPSAVVSGSGGRQSLDERRTLAPEFGVGNGNSERRASFHE